MSKLVEQLQNERNLTDGQFKELIETDAFDHELSASALDIREKYYGRDVYIRGLIEISSYCKNDCYYCGIRRSNDKAQRYRLSEEEILKCCIDGYAMGFRTFVLQGGEDLYFTDEKICGIVSEIKRRFPDCAVTLSLGEKTRKSYQCYFEAGADRYLLRHETAGREHYRKLHPAELLQEKRMQCLWDLKEIGYQVGSGFMVGSPYQTTEDLISDLRFLQELQPDMIGIGPFIRHRDTPFRDFDNGDFSLCLRMTAILRHIFPDVLLPATTALGTIDPSGRERGLLAGANVVMPNLSPVCVREKYSLYDNKICTGEEAAECRESLENRIASVGFRIVVDRGDRRNFKSCNREENMKDDIEIFNVFGDDFDRFGFPGKQYRVTAGRGGEAILIIGSEKTAVIDCGMAYCGGDMVKNIMNKLAEEGRSRLDFAFLTHSHYDHMGALPYLRKAFPNVVVYGSAHCQAILQRPNAKLLMKKLGTAARDLYRPQSREEISVDNLTVDIVLRDGDIISLGNETIQAIEAKGHTDCSMAYAVEPDSILFTSESTGIVEAGLAVNTPILKSFADAEKSLEKCRAYGAKYICLPHFGLIPQDFNEEYWQRFEQGCADRIKMAQEMKEEGLDADQMLERYRDRYWDPIMEQEQPIEAFLINAENIIKAALKALDMKEK